MAFLPLGTFSLKRYQGTCINLCLGIDGSKSKQVLYSSLFTFSPETSHNPLFTLKKGWFLYKLSCKTCLFYK